MDNTLPLEVLYNIIRTNSQATSTQPLI